jgi:elongation factor P--(R)-beta-lysine ligase
MGSMSHSPTARDWSPRCDLDLLAFRAKLLREVRNFFDRQGFLEVETPILSHDTVVDANIDPLTAEFRADRTVAPKFYYLQTSPEFAMKRLIAAGAEAIYQVAHVFRNGEAGRLHNPEFTMIEWYRVGDTHFEQMALTEALVRTLAVGSGRDLESSPFLRLSYDEAFERAVGRRVLEMSPTELHGLCRDCQIELPASLPFDDRDGLLNLILAGKVESTLGIQQPEFVFDFPDSQAALAIVRLDDPPVAERFELYWRGIELCNGYHELTDSLELRRRMTEENRKRKLEGAEQLPEHNRLLDAMEAGLPACAGVALGFDRLVMMLAGKNSLAEVLPFPFPRA